MLFEQCVSEHCLLPVPMFPRAVQLWVITMAASSKAAQQLLGQHVYVNVLLFSHGVWMWQLCVKR